MVVITVIEYRSAPLKFHLCLGMSWPSYPLRSVSSMMRAWNSCITSDTSELHSSGWRVFHFSVMSHSYSPHQIKQGYFLLRNIVLGASNYFLFASQMAISMLIANEYCPIYEIVPAILPIRKVGEGPKVANHGIYFISSFALLCNVLFLAIFQVWWSLKNNPEYGRVAESCHRPKVELQLFWALDLANMVTT